MSLVLLYPLAAGSYSLYVMSLALVFGMLALSVDLLWGYAGILNLGPAVAFGLGGYAYAILMKGMGGGLLVTLLALLVAIVVPLAITLLISYAGFKSKTTLMYYALINLALALTLEQVAVVMIRYTGGSSGLINFPYPKIGIGPFSVVIFSSIQIYYFVAVTALSTPRWAG
jgi:ABC-type branched-subunit amino acid transport system permease subunit